MKGGLDTFVLQHLGLGPDTMEEKYALFFHQLILPMCDVAKSGARRDPCMNYYSEVENGAIYMLHNLALHIVLKNTYQYHPDG
mmetsp:Transcript_8710/g.12653  ORF Transcript_8710/g.12653 Transcript_8710/m.12653 type:complete len:83 (+) Transcript_8710:269-517(+)